MPRGTMGKARWITLLLILQTFKMFSAKAIQGSDGAGFCYGVSSLFSIIAEGINK